MNKKFRLSTLCLTLITVPFFFISTTVSAHPHLAAKYSYDNGYDDGYEDGYDDAMDDCPCPPRIMLGGFYAGLSAGYEGFQIQRKPIVLDDRIGTLNTHANGWNGRLFGGYGRYFNNFYLGGELFVGDSAASGTDSINTTGLQYDGKFSVGASVGASIIPGYKLNGSGTLLYGRLGYISTEFTAKDWSGMSGSNTSKWTSGFNTGIGVEVPLYKNISGRMEYDYINYSHLSNNTNGAYGSTNNPSDNRGSVDILMRF